METMNKKQFENEVKENLKSVKDFAKSSVEDFFKDTKIMFVVSADYEKSDGTKHYDTIGVTKSLAKAIKAMNSQAHLISGRLVEDVWNVGGGVTCIWMMGSEKGTYLSATISIRIVHEL